jgi:K+-sensing histidine kinase KdpD
MQGLLHELRTPVQAVIGHASLFDYTQGPEAARERIQRIHQGGIWLRLIVEDLALRDGLASGAILIRPSWVPLAPLLDEVIDEFSDPFPKRLRARVQPAMVWADPRYLTTVLSFLIHNALRLSAEEPRNAVSVRGENLARGRYRLSVIQAIPLIPLAQAESLFAGADGFPVAKRLPKQGLGLGLQPGREVLRRCDGDLVYRTRPTRFVLSLKER